MLIHTLKTLKTLMLMAVTAPPFLMLIIGCTFGAPEPSKDGGIFTNIERGRQCATTADIEMGIDIAKQDEQGFWIGGTSMYGLDYSAAATAQCSGMPQKILFHGSFPEGSHLCVVPSSVGPGLEFPTVTAAAQAACDKLKLIDEDGTPYRCDHVAWPAHRANKVFEGACTPAGTPLTSFQDPRKLPPLNPVAAWNNPVNVLVNGATLRKMSATPDYDAGANAPKLLSVAVNGAVEFTATEIDKERTAGFAEGGFPDNDISDADIDYAVVLRNNGTLLVNEKGATKYTGTYAAGDKIRLVVLGGTVVYLKNDKPLFGGTVTQATVLRFSVSLKDKDATITNAQTTF